MMVELENDQLQANIQKQSSPGTLLRVVREAKDISLSDAAVELRLTVQRLSDLENDQFSEMGAITFAKGYLRSYARFLGVSEEEVLQAFEHSGFGSDIPSNKPKLLNEKMTDAHPKSSRWFGYAVLLILAILAAFWWHNRATIPGSFFNTAASAAPQHAGENTLPVSVNESFPIDQAPAEQASSLGVVNESSPPSQSTTTSPATNGMSLMNSTPEPEFSTMSQTQTNNNSSR